MNHNMEAPCEETGDGCVWIDEEWEDGDEYHFDTYCFNCYRSRLYSLEEYKKND